MTTTVDLPRSRGSSTPPISGLSCSLYTVPADRREGDGTLAWSSTSVVVASVEAGGLAGLGWTYAGRGSKAVIEDELSKVVIGSDPMDVPGMSEAMIRACRNLGRAGAVGAAISAVDIALWDLKAKLLGAPLSLLFGRCRHSVPIYGSGGFTPYDAGTTAAQLRSWVEAGIKSVKIKIAESWGSETDRDLGRVELARTVVGDGVQLFVDANGGYSRKQAVRMGRQMAEEYGVIWFEEPVSSDDLAGLHEVRDQVTADVAAGEYGFDEIYFARMLEAEAVDCLQVDVTRCGGYTAWLRSAAIAAGHNLEVSAHCAPNLHVPVAAAVPNFRHIEYFHDHSRIESLLFDGSLTPEDGALLAPTWVLGHGMELKTADAEHYRVS